ncbi:hypothetical protein FN846DRAFT_885735 [Sphaerosporella brunnea]|uniref:Uncharacterized protein n=1 Tax=Sphaerosporella brunnea TaxID=1250544 RepID=A0A5J5FC78_9PEZI|nr:hypothetical protein FN846DRAFT_885735 [Sphaerosporella brunnea]
MLHAAVDSALSRVVGSAIAIAIPVSSIEDQADISNYIFQQGCGPRTPRCQLFLKHSTLAQSLGCAITACTPVQAVLMPGPGVDHAVILHSFMNEVLAAVQAPSFLPSSWPKHIIFIRSGVDVDCHYSGEVLTVRPDGSLLFRGDGDMVCCVYPDLFRSSTPPLSS